MTESTVQVPRVSTIDDQQPLVDAVLNGDGPRWLLWFDGLRYDTAAALYDEYLTGDIQPVHNHDIGYTGDWAAELLSGEYPDLGLFSPVPLWGFAAADYDEREHFGVVPDPDAYDETSIVDRLAALGYREQTDALWTQHAEEINDVVRDHLEDVTGGIIRYVQPHPPLAGLEALTSGSGKIGRVETAIKNDDISQADLRDAYRETAHAAFRGAVDLIPDLPGEVALTADHGEALYEDCCRQVFHARSHDPCQCLTTVPFIHDVEVR